MKKIVLLLAFLGFSFLDCLAEGVKFLEDGKEWVYTCTDPSVTKHSVRYVLNGDTVVGDVACKKLVSYTLHSQEDNIGSVAPHYRGALYEEGQKIYLFRPGRTEAVLLYDFGLSVGDKAEVAGFESYRRAKMNIVVTGETTVEVDGRSLRVLEYASDFETDEPDTYSYGGWWIEGVGGCRNLIPSEDDSFWFFNMLTSVTMGGTSFDALSLLRQQENGNRMAYRPFLADNKRWKYRYHHFDDDGNETIYDKDYYLDGDTIIGGQTWRKMYSALNDGSQVTSVYDGAWREEDKKVYTISKNSQDVEMWYDFDMLPNEITKQAGPRSQLYFTHVDTVEVGGRLFMRHHYADCRAPLDTYCCVEGIGGITGLLPFAFAVIMGQRDYSEYVGVYEDGECIFTPEDFMKESYTLAVDKPQTATIRKHDGKVYDLQGRKVQSNRVTRSQSNTLLKGIYIHNGKTVIVK